MPKEPRDTSDWIDIRGDGGVLKHVLREGNKAAGHPIDGWCCKVNFDAYIEGGWFDGRFVETTRDRPVEDGDGRGCSRRARLCRTLAKQLCHAQCEQNHN